MASKPIVNCHECWMYNDTLGACNFYGKYRFYAEDTKPDFCKVSWINVCEVVEMDK